MLLLTDVLVLSGVSRIIYWIYKANEKPARYPPGPFGIPVLGYIPFMDSVAPHKTITQLAKTYGDVFSLKLGSRDVVYLNSYDAAKEAFGNPHILGRPDFETFKLSLTRSSFLSRNQHEWETHRRFTLRHLKDFGFGKASMETVIAKEAEKLIQRFHEKKGEPFQLSNTVNITVVNILWHMTAGLNLDYHDPYYKMLMEYIGTSQKVFSRAFFADFLTWGAHLIPHRITKLDLIKTARVVLNTFIQKLIDDHEKTLNYDNPRDLIDTFLIEKKIEEEAGIKESLFNYEILTDNAATLFIAGSETVSTTLKGAILLLAQHRGIEEKVKKEIQAVTGGERRVSLQDKYNLPYLEAFIMEAQRYLTITPFGMPHNTTENTTVWEYQIPKNTVVIANQWAIHFDEKYWKDPMLFNPDRFLNEDGTANYTKEGFMPFSLGKRQCLGLQLAKAKLFLFLGYLLQEFTFRLPPGAPSVSVFDATGGAVVNPSPFEIIATPS